VLLLLLLSLIPEVREQYFHVQNNNELKDILFVVRNFAFCILYLNANVIYSSLCAGLLITEPL